jgi:chorismate mutase
VIKIKKELELLRNEINSVDDAILELFEKRAKAVHKVGELKKNSPVAIYVPEREQAIFERLTSKSALPKEIIISLYRELISSCRSLEGILTVAILEDFYSEAALRQILGTHVDSVSFKNLSDLEKSLSNFEYALLQANEENLKFLTDKNLSVLNRTTFKGEEFLLIHI